MPPKRNENGCPVTQVPDGGYGWVVLASSFLVMMVIDGLFGCYGILLPDIMEGLQASPSLTSLAGSLIIGALLFTALLACPLIERFSCRQIAFVGSVIGCLGLAASSFVRNIWLFLFTYGVITGFGFGLMYLPTIVMVNRYFDKRRGIATSIMFAGSGMGVFVISPLTEHLLGVFGWRGTILMLAGIVLQMCVACALYKLPEQAKADEKYKAVNVASQDYFDYSVEEPTDHLSVTSASNVSSKIKDYREREEKLVTEQDYLENTALIFLNKNENTKQSTSSLPHSMFQTLNENGIKSDFRSHRCLNVHPDTFKETRNSNKSLLSQKDILYSGSLRKIHSLDRKHGTKKDFENHIQSQTSFSDSDTTESESIAYCSFHLLKNKAFFFIALGALLTQMAQFIPNMFLGDYGKTIGLTGGQISLTYALFGVINTIGRLFPGFIVDNTNVSANSFCCLGMVGCAVTCFLFPLCDSFPTVLTFAIAFGFFIAFFCPLQPIMVLDAIGLDDLTKGLSVMTVVKGPAAIAGPPLAGMLYESAQDYNITMMFTGILCLTTALVYMIIPIQRLFLSFCK